MHKPSPTHHDMAKTTRILVHLQDASQLQ